MTAYSFVEAAVVTMLVAASALWLFVELAPGAAASVRARIAALLGAPGRPRRLRALAAKLAARPASAAGCGSGGCSSCSGCGLSRVPKPPAGGSIQTL